MGVRETNNFNVDSQHLKLFLNKHFGLLMVLPALITLLLILVGPVLYTLFLSFHQWFASSVSGPQWVGLDNFGKIITEKRFFQSLQTTGLFTFCSLALQTIFGVGLAQFLNRPFKGKSLVRTLLVLPIASTPVATSLVWRLMLHPTLGIINYFLKLLGMGSLAWLSDPILALPTVIAIDIWHWTPLVMLITMAGMSTVSETLYEAGKIDGATGWALFRHITLPLVRPAIIVAIMLRFMDSLKQFDMIYVTTQGGPGIRTQILNLYIFDNAFRYFNIGYASSLIIVMFILIFSGNVLLSNFRRNS